MNNFDFPLLPCVSIFLKINKKYATALRWPLSTIYGLAVSRVKEAKGGIYIISPGFFMTNPLYP